MYDDDSRLRTLNQDLKSARSTQTSLQGKKDQYLGQKARLTQELDALRGVEKELTLALGPVSEEAGPLPAHQMKVVRAQAQIHGAHHSLLKNLNQQIAILTRIHDEAGGLNAELTSALKELQESQKRADVLAKQSEKDLVDLVEMLTSKDPDKASMKWLNKRVAKLTKALLKDVGLAVKTYADQMAAKISPEDKAKQKELSQWLVGRIKGDDVGAVPTMSTTPPPARSERLNRVANLLAESEALHAEIRSALGDFGDLQAMLNRD